MGDEVNIASMGFGVELADATSAELLTDGLTRVEAALDAAVDHVDRQLSEVSHHLLAAGGKRFRPLLTLLAAQLGPPQAKVPEEVIKAAVVVELTHLASLYHDDVMDEALMRRGAASANSRWGNSVAILTGDLLFARASLEVADLGAEAVRIQAKTFELLCTGQIRETVGPQAGVDPVAHYLQVLSEKTGSLIATAGRFGAWFGGCDAEVINIMHNYGERIGVAFQLADDLIDLASESGDSGKAQGTDLREGISTLPVLLAKQSTQPSDERLRWLLAQDLAEDHLHAEALELLCQHPVMDEARSQTRHWADQARLALTELPPSPVKQSLEDLAIAVVERTG